MAATGRAVTIKTDRAITIKVTKTEGLALLKAAETGLSVVRVLGLVPNTTTMESAVRLLRGQVT